MLDLCRGHHLVALVVGATQIPTVMLLGDAMVPLVRAAGALEADDVPPFAVIGGVVVAVRLGRVLRATADLDTVTDYRYAPTALEILKRRDDADYDPADPHTISLAGTQVQFQDVVAVTDADVEHLEPKDLLYVAGHAHALERATLVTISASDRDGPVAATVPVATAGALVAMKLHAYLDRRSTSGPDKRPGDLRDIYNLLLFVPAEAADDLSSAGHLLQNVVASTVERLLVADAARARTILNGHARPLPHRGATPRGSAGSEHRRARRGRELPQSDAQQASRDGDGFVVSRAEP